MKKITCLMWKIIYYVALIIGKILWFPIDVLMFFLITILIAPISPTLRKKIKEDFRKTRKNEKK